MTTLRMHHAVVPHNTLRMRAPVPCLNCDVALVGEFCHRCGQAASTPAKVTFWQVVCEIPRAAWDFERALPHTILGLLVRPGRLMRDFLAGRRAQIYSPIALLFVLSGLLGVATSTLHLHQLASARDSDVGETVFAYYSWIVVLCVPIQAIGPTWILRRRLGLGFGEQFIVSAMAATGVAALGLLFAPVEWYANTHGSYGWRVQFLGSALKALYLVRVYVQLQDDGTKEWFGRRVFRAIASVFAHGFMFILALALVAIASMAVAHVRR